jgi:hypothetical protein
MIRSTLFLAVVSGFILQGCQKEDGPNSALNSSSPAQSSLKSQEARTFYGPTTPIGKGVARAWVTENEDGAPIAVGLNFTEKALENMPADPSAWVLDLPDIKGMGFYKHVLFDWNPQGHEPPGIYDVPHFDFHFYTISSAERMAITPDKTAEAANAPAPQYAPPLYLNTQGLVPEMGVHWIDLLAPEFHGVPFTQTFIWGSFDGKFIFWEPMVTLAYLRTKPDSSIPVRQPAAFQQDGWYAQNYKVAYSVVRKEYTVALTDLAFHAGE